MVQTEVSNRFASLCPVPLSVQIFISFQKQFGHSIALNKSFVINFTIFPRNSIDSSELKYHPLYSRAFEFVLSWSSNPPETPCRSNSLLSVDQTSNHVRSLSSNPDSSQLPPLNLCSKGNVHRTFKRKAQLTTDSHALAAAPGAMIDVFKSLRSLVKISRLQIDNNVLRLHYSFTVLLLMAFCVVVSTKQYVGEPIDCVRTEAVSQSVINTYCWMHTTYTIPKSLLKKVGVEVPHPGIDQVTDSREFRYHSYYQWVCFVLFVQATLFYAPRWLWKLWEGGKLQALVMDLEVANCSNQERRIKCDLLANYLMLSRGHHDWYAARQVPAVEHIKGKSISYLEIMLIIFRIVGFSFAKSWP